METRAWSLFGDGKRNPSVLPATEIKTANAQAISDDPIKVDEDIKPKIDRRIDKEDVDKRTAFTSTYTNKDGTKTLRHSSNQKNYKKGNQWLEINNKLSPKLLEQPKNFLDFITGSEPSPIKSDEFSGEAGIIKTTMGSLNDGIVLSFENRTLKVTPVGAKDVKPTQKDDRTVVYKEAWPGVDLEYELRGEIVKEKLVLKNKNVQTEFNFKVEGGKLYTHPMRKGELAVEGVDPAQFSFSSLTLDVNGRGVISEERVSQVATKNGLKAIVDKEWLKQQQKDAFPMIVDPSFYRYNDVGQMFKSDGFGCNQTNCHFNTGTLNDGYGWKHWRTYFTFDYAQAAGKNLLYASLQMPMAGGINGEPGGRWLNMSWANCIGFHCVGHGARASAHVGTWAHLDITEVIRPHLANSSSGAWFGIWGEEGPYKSYKPFYEMHIDVVYDSPTPVPTIVEPADKQVTVNTQPTLRINPVSDPDGPVKYSYVVSTNADGSGAVVNSGWTSVTQWTIPDGVLQDGTTYYWRVYAKDDHPYSQPVVTGMRSIKIDLRTGKDSTQSYDTVGPIGVDLATGNASTSAATHAMNALGGTIGLNMDYNTPTKAKNGLIGEYWNVSSGNTTPSGSSQLVRNDQDINFSWPNGTSPGAGINADWFTAKWKGYFVAPNTGDYQFGASQDDSVTINVNGQNFSGCYGTSPCYNGGSIHLIAGQVVSINVQFTEATGDGYFRMYVKGAVPEQIVPRDWLRTEVQPSVAQYGLSGRYYTDDGNHNFPADPQDLNRLMLARTDPKIAFNWSTGGPASGLQGDNFMAKWTGYVTVPVNGNYTFGADTDDGIRIKLNNGFLGAQQVVLDSWQPQATRLWGSQQSLSAGQPIPITVEYFEQGGGASINLLVRDANGVEQEIPVKWLTPKASVLPDAWRLGIDADGNIGYERLRVAGQNIILEDSTRATHEYIWTGSGYKPPVNEDGILTKNANNTYTLIDADGRIYVFDAEGKLTSLTTPADDRQPASLKYEYSGDPSRLVKISDGVTNSRYGTLHYKGSNEEGNCSIPSGFDAAPDGMLCAFKTSDGRITKLYYNEGQLSRIEKPGNELTDYEYDSLGRIISTRDSVANDVVEAGIRTDDNSVRTELEHDPIGRVSAIKAPAATTGASRVNHTFEYQSGVTRMHISGAPEPNGFSKKVEYDNLLRTIKESDVANLSVATEWDPVKDLQLSTADATGLKSTTIYDTDDRLTDSHGPAPASWYDGERKPIASYAGQVPHVRTGYDEGITGLAVSVYDNAKLLRTPKLMTTGMTNLPYGSYGLDLTNTLVIPTDGMSMRATGKIRLDKVGAYSFKVWHGDGARVYIDDQLINNDWVNGGERFSAVGTYNNTTVGKLARITIESYKNGTSGSGVDGRLFVSLNQLEPGGSVWTEAIGGQYSPGYDLTTSTTAYDAQVGNVESKTEYSNPAYGTVSKTILDPTELNYQSTATYEATGTGFLRQTSKTLPGGGTTTYQHYGAEETRDNPCTSETETFVQAGLPKGKTEQSTITQGNPVTGPTPVVRSVSSGSISSGALSLAKPAGTINGDLLVITASGDLSSSEQLSYVVDAGWIQLLQPTRSDPSGAGNNLQIWYKIANNEPATYAITPDHSNLIGGSIMRIDGHNATSPIGVSNVTASLTGEASMPSVTTTTANNLLLRLATWDQSKTLNAIPEGHTGLYHVDVSGHDNWGGFKEQATAGSSGVAQFDLSSGAPYVGFTVAVNPQMTGGQSQTQPGRSSETVYNESGIIVATRYNDDPWTCIEYDDRGRTKRTIIPTLGNKLGRTIVNNYAVDGNPLKTSVDDGNGTITTATDLLGRTVGYTDVHDKTTTSTYDNLGRLTSRSGPLGTESFTYSDIDRLIEQKLDGTVVSVPHYDQYGRLTSVDYPTAGQQKLNSITRDANGRTTRYSYILGDGSTIGDSVTRSQSGMVLAGSRSINSNILNSTYAYDKAGRLTGATIGNNTYAYEFGALDASCGTGEGINQNAGKNSNRTKQIVNGVSTTYCYDQADRLVSSSDPLVNNPQYDAHGNTTQIGTTISPLRLKYDSSDRNSGLEQFDANGNGKAVYYERDALDRITARYQNNITNWDWQDNGTSLYGFTGTGDTPDYVMGADHIIREKYLSLLGGVLLTLRPNETDQAKQAVHSLSNIHGDVFATTDKNGTLTDSFDYDPFGNRLSGVADADNSQSGSFGWVGGARKQTENDFALNVTQMGARVYVPSLGRFLQVDPVEGGMLNNYVYAMDPVNQYDLNGKFAFIPVVIAIAMIVRAVVTVVLPVVIIAVAKNILKSPATKQAGSQIIKNGGSQIMKNAGRSGGSAAKPSVPPAPKQMVLPNMSATRQMPPQVHGNSLQSQRPTWGYKLYSNDGTFLKNGITSRQLPENRYTKGFMQDKYMDKVLFGNRYDAYTWEYEQNLMMRGPLNKNMH